MKQLSLFFLIFLFFGCEKKVSQIEVWFNSREQIFITSNEDSLVWETPVGLMVLSDLKKEGHLLSGIASERTEQFANFPSKRVYLIFNQKQNELHLSYFYPKKPWQAEVDAVVSSGNLMIFKKTKR